LPENHPCSRLHGHNYIVILDLQSEHLNSIGFVVDYRSLDAAKEWIDETFDHQHINDQVPFNPSAENLAAYIYYELREEFPWLVAVTVKETNKTAARFQP